MHIFERCLLKDLEIQANNAKKYVLNVLESVIFIEFRFLMEIFEKFGVLAFLT